MTRIARLLAVLAALCACPWPARAQQGPKVMTMPYVLACATIPELEAALRANGEHVVARGVALGGAPFDQTAFWINPSSQEWSVVLVNGAANLACLVVAGTKFRGERPSVPAAPGTPERAS